MERHNIRVIIISLFRTNQELPNYIFSFIDVYKGLYKNQFVAVKQLKDQDRAAQAFLKEASVMT